ncbi:MAG: UvrD-helicase domain-containing protein [Verrucomicrobiae bacterium]
MSREIPHQMVIANAGSGKTHKLTTRMVTLLLLGVEPRKIAALTFTKKAAAEFLDAVFQRLAAAATDEVKLKNLRDDTGIADIDAGKCRDVLRRLVSQMGVLCMGTIDGLFARIARAFPLESGLAGDFTMLGTSELQAARDDALAAVFRDCSSNPAIFDEFLDLVRQQSRNQSERGIFSALLKSVESCHSKLIATPAGVVWGDRKAIWPTGSPILSAGDCATSAAALWKAIEGTHPQLDAAAAAAWRSHLDLAASPDKAWPKELEKFVAEKLCKCSTDKKSGEEYLPTGGAKAARVYLNAEVSEARTALLRALIKPEYESLLRRSASLHAMMRRFESAYDTLTRSRGRLTFSDITDLLAARVDDPAWSSAVGYRLDARYDHWMLDEFQDTSRPQWHVLSTFIDEVVQDSGGTRSFFYVGDTKQAIYSWRGGDPKLFFEIRDLYNSAGEARITSDTLSKSYRSTQEIMDAVNSVFGNIAAVQGPLELADRTVSDWTQAWQPHVVAPVNEGKTGFVRWVPVEVGKSDEDNDEDDPRDLEILKILKETEPWLRGWSCAVLYRKNDKAAALAALLRSEGIPVALEGNTNPCTNNPLGAAILAALRFAASPDDTLSGCLLAGSPLAILQNGEFAFRENALEMIARSGFEETIRQWVASSDLTHEPFLASCAADFLDAASEFDAAGSGGILDFLAFVESYQVQEPECADVVRVMTVHQAKGLTFDMAIVSGLDDRAAQTNNDLVLGRPPAWGMLLPKKNFADQDPTLAAAGESLRADKEYGDLCTAYVAMTRPRFGLYLITKQLGKTSASKNFARLLALTLGEPREFGNQKWFEARGRIEISGDLPVTADSALPAPTSGTPKPVSPSASTALPPETRDQKSPARSREASDLGSEIHAALAAIAWLEESPPSFPKCSDHADRLLEAFFATPTARNLFRRPDEPCELWREKPFDVLVGGQWVSGVFDRVHIRLHPDGQPASATIYDFKTDKAPPEEIRSRYAHQMAAYSTAAAILLGLSTVAAETVPIRIQR